MGSHTPWFKVKYRITFGVSLGMSIHISEKLFNKHGLKWILTLVTWDMIKIHKTLKK